MPLLARVRAGVVVGVCGALACGARTTLDSNDPAATSLQVRLVAPLSTSTVTTARPTLRWVLPAGADGAQIDLCRDRGCRTLETSFLATGTSARPTSPLTPGVHYWRAHPVVRGVVTKQDATVWELFVRGQPSVPPAVDTSWGSVPDFDGDGLADVVLAGLQATYVLPGTRSGPSTSPAAALPASGGVLVDAGDVNGDGFADLVCGTGLHFGGPGGLSGTPSPGFEPSGPFDVFVTAVGDVNRDGFADLVVRADNTTLRLYVGGPGGPDPSAGVRLATLSGAVMPAWTSSAGDVDGDGFADFVVAQPSTVAPDDAGYVGPPLTLFRGSAGGPLPLATANLADLPAVGAFPGDFNGDGYGDLAWSVDTAGSSVTLLPGSAGGFGPPLTWTLPTPAGRLLRGLFHAGDVNGDGFDDVVVLSTPETSLPIPTALEGDVFPGGPAGLSPTASRVLSSLQGASFLDLSPASLGDVNGDGFADVLVTLGRGGAATNTLLFYPGGTSASAGAGSTVASPAASDPGIGVALSVP